MAIQPIGYLKLWREIATKPIWLNSTPEQKSILITIMMMVNFKPKQWEWKGEQFEVESGQVITSIDTIVKNCGKGITIQNVRSALKRFEKLGFLTNESTKTGRLITVGNWSLYQSEEENQHSSQQRGNKEVTDSQQRGNKEVTPREEGNKENNEIINNIKPLSENNSDDISEQKKQAKLKLENDIEEIWKAYPNKKGKASYLKKIPALIKKYGKDKLIASIRVYDSTVKDKNYLMHGSTYFNGGYLDYINSEVKKYAQNGSNDSRLEEERKRAIERNKKTKCEEEIDF